MSSGGFFCGWSGCPVGSDSVHAHDDAGRVVERTIQHDLDDLTQNARFAADMVAIRSPGRTPAETTRWQIRAALELLIGNGLISVTPREQWPGYVVLDPPYPLLSQDDLSFPASWKQPEPGLDPT